jgi:hydrogenase expression/formation protein HypD
MNYKIEDIIKAINSLAEGADTITIMEVCGTHTASIRRFGISSILPKNIKFVSGPGCPVCVTSQEDIAAAVDIADRDDVIFTCFGDMMRVPCGSVSLYSLKEAGRDIRLVTSPMDALEIAKANPNKQVVYFGIGFETTAPHTAALVETAFNQKITNLSIYNAHKTMPEAVMQLLSGQNKINALLCPGHVAAVIGSDAFSFVPEKLNLPAAISGFEAYDIMAAVLKITEMCRYSKIGCINMYPKAVTAEGNRSAIKLLYQFMEPDDAVWRGLGNLPQSGLKFRKQYEHFDARTRFEIKNRTPEEPKGCICARILRGEKTPDECIHFGKDCMPDSPLGPCMVSSEGSCAAYYKYRE